MPCASHASRLRRSEEFREGRAHDAPSSRPRLLNVTELFPIRQDGRREILAALAPLVHYKMDPVGRPNRHSMERLAVLAAGAHVAVEILHVDDPGVLAGDLAEQGVVDGLT
jgi:hypothetical protein